MSIHEHVTALHLILWLFYLSMNPKLEIVLNIINILLITNEIMINHVEKVHLDKLKSRPGKWNHFNNLTTIYLYT